MNTVSFPGLGIEGIRLNPTAFTIPIFGGLSVRWYAIIIVCGIFAAFIYASKMASKNGITADNILDVVVFTVFFGVVGARLYYVLTNLDSYKTFGEVIAVWNGGLAIYGGIIAGGLTLFIMCRIYKLDWLKVFDTAAPGVMLAQAIGRWGNFVNCEAYGVAPAESNPLYFLRMIIKTPGETEIICQPTFLYESLWNLIGFALINVFYKKRTFKGQVFLWYATWYGFGRMFIEALRTDSLYVGPFRISQLVGLVTFLTGATLLVVFGILNHGKRYDPSVAPAKASSASGAPSSEPAPADSENAADEKATKEAGQPDEPAADGAEPVPDNVEKEENGTVKEEKDGDTD